MNMFFLIRWLFRGNRFSTSVSFIIFFQKGGNAYVICCHLKLKVLLKPKYTAPRLKDLIISLLSNNQIIGRQKLGLCQKNNEKR